MRRVLTTVSIGAVGVVTASAAWACAPGGHLPGTGAPPGDRQTRLSSCTPPQGATRPCKPLLGTPTFPNATAVKGPAGSTVSAYVSGGLDPGEPFTLRFLGKPQLDSGTSCHSDQSTAMSDPRISDLSGALSNTRGTIPPGAPLGGGQVCFASVARSEGSIPATFKVVI